MAKTDPQKAERWRQHIESYQESRLTRKAYCRKHRLNIHTLDYWHRKLTQTHEAHIKRTDKGFVQVRVNDDAPSDSCIKLRIGQITVEVTDGFELNHLKNILRVLGAAC